MEYIYIIGFVIILIAVGIVWGIRRLFLVQERLETQKETNRLLLKLYEQNDAKSNKDVAYKMSTALT